MNKRVKKRINIGLDAAFGSSCMALTENISEGGIYVKIACTETAANIRPGAMVNLALELPSGKLLTLKCKKVWSNKNTSNSLIEHIGVEIINPPDEYKFFYHRLRLQNFKWQ
ncbi:MAG: hypothetical protein AMK71_11470 [Nitrospira bacterium SG8_35_4]|nr:MAG: hypothetical protein AMK71_11470 [Nitrospira bacterium SG8_35_4]